MAQSNGMRFLMICRSWAIAIVSGTLAAFLAGCGGGNTANVQNPPPPPPPAQLAIAFQPQPSGSIPVSFTENIVAVVSDDSNNYGVDWSVTCQNPSNCGSLSVQHTASGTATTYTAPQALSTNSMVVEIVAFATADHTKNVVAPVTITAFNNSLSGTYVLQAQGVDAGFNPYLFAGVVVLDGSGGISSGIQTVNFFDPLTGTLICKSDNIVPANSSYFIGSDGRGTITLDPNDADIGSESFSMAFLSGSKAFIDALPTQTLTVTGTGTMDLQQANPTALSGGYAFVVRGSKNPTLTPLAFGGVLNVDSPGQISGAGSVVDEIVARNLNANGLGISGTVTAPDAFGTVTLNLMAPFGNANKMVTVQFTGYIVDNSHLRLIESDNISGTGFGLTAGLAVGQGVATGTFKDNSSFSGNYVYGILGTDLSNLNLAPSTLTSAAVFTADGSGNISDGFTDTFLAVNSIQGNGLTGAQISASFDGNYLVDSSGTGRTILTVNNFKPIPTSGYQPLLFLYLTGSGNSDTPLVLAGGDKHYPFVGAGIAYTQSASPTFGNQGGAYGINFTQQQFGSSENDGTGEVNVSPSLSALSGAADVNFGFGANFDQPFTGSFSALGSNGVFPSTLSGTNNSVSSSVAFTPPIATDFFAIDPDHGFFIETDLRNAVAPEQPGQVSLGYYSTRIPLCNGCQ